jgi:DNA (cytosine-5)-methyltransferase 1
MAVPPKAVKINIEAVFKTFAGVSYDWIQPKISNKNGNNKKQNFLFT